MNDTNLKPYDRWNEKKKQIATSDKYKRIYFREGDVWWCSLGINVGSEALGKGDNFRRPVLVIKKLSADACIVIPLTSRKKEGSWFVDITLHQEEKTALLYQVRMLHIKRFQRKLGQLDESDFMRVKQKLGQLLEFCAEKIITPPKRRSMG
jgi:mRNA interferase MazF